MDEMTQLTSFRSEVPLPGPAELAVEETRLRSGMAAPVRRRRRRLYVVAAGLSAAAVTAGVVALGAGHRSSPPVAHVMPAAYVQVLDRAAHYVHAQPELQPRAGQFLVYESQMMNESQGNGAAWLYRERRKVWIPVKGDATHGVIETDELAPAAFPGRPIPPVAYQGLGPGKPSKLADFDQRASYLRTDYAYLSKLPTVPAKMYAFLYTGLGNGPAADEQAWQRVGGDLSEAYMPAAQRAALFKAAQAIHGATMVAKAVDAAGRTGVAAARVDAGGVLDEYIFDPATYQFLGARSVVVDAAKAGAPVGSVLTSTAQLSVTVADHAPDVRSSN
jgi:hypothetical protein